MPKQDNLHQFIHSMSRSEKRYFSTEVKRKGGEYSNYKRLFDALNNMKKEYDVVILEKRFHGEALLKNINREKKALFDILLRIIRNLQNEKSENAKIKEMLLNAALLQERGMHEKSQKLLERAKSKAYFVENYTIILEIIPKQRIVSMNLGKRESEIEKLLDEQSKVIAILEKQNRLNKILYELLFISTKGLSRNVDKLECCIESVEELNDLEVTCFHSKVKYHQILGIYYGIVGKNIESIHSYKKIIALWEKHPKLIDEYTYRYGDHLMNYLYSCIKIQDYKTINESSFEELRKISTNRLGESAKGFQDLYSFMLVYYLNNGNIEGAVSLVPEIERGLKKFGNQITKERQKVFINNISSLFFLKEDYSSSLEWLEKQINTNEKLIRTDLQRISRIIKGIILYELEEFEKFDKNLRSLTRYFANEDNINVFEDSCIGFLNNLKSATPGELKKYMSEFVRSLQTLNNSPKARSFAWLDELTIWANAKLYQKKLIDQLQLYLNY